MAMNPKIFGTLFGAVFILFIFMTPGVVFDFIHFGRSATAPASFGGSLASLPNTGIIVTHAVIAALVIGPSVAMLSSTSKGEGFEDKSLADQAKDAYSTVKSWVGM